MILIIDFGSQFNQLIARRVRECRVYCQIESPAIRMDEIRNDFWLTSPRASFYRADRPVFMKKAARKSTKRFST